MTKGKATGQTRAIGPPPDQVEQAQEEVRPDFKPSEMTEKIFNRKLMEIRGRILVHRGGQGRTNVQVRADEKLGEALMASTACGETRKTSPTRKSKEDSEPVTPKKVRSPSKEKEKPQDNSVKKEIQDKGYAGRPMASTATRGPIAMSVNSEDTVEEIPDSEAESKKAE